MSTSRDGREWGQAVPLVDPAIGRDPHIALEDWLGAGAILRWLPGRRSPEAEAAIAAFDQQRERLSEVLAECGSGQELEDRGHRDDTPIAAALDVISCVPRFDGVAFVAL